jgi:D-alanine-D-alanine ligase
LPPAEMIFHNYQEGRPRIVDFKAKWEVNTFEYANTVRAFPGDKIDPDLKEKIGSVAIRCWNTFGLKGYARVDMRIDINNNPFVIEVNANPCISPDSGLVAATIEANLPFTSVIQRILNDLNC